MVGIKGVTKIADAPDLHKGVFSFFASLAIVLFVMFVMIGGLMYFTDISFNLGSGTGLSAAVFLDEDTSSTDTTGTSGTSGSTTSTITKRQACERIGGLIRTITGRHKLVTMWALGLMMNPDEFNEMAENFKVLCGDVV